MQNRYEKLNPEQRQAVDTIEGPVLVVAGPGSGKTELLSLRVANILRKTDTLPSSILCLTFTEAAATNMRKRLIGLIGKEAYKVAIHTFHSFGAEIISQNPEYFYQGALYNPADRLVQIQILEEIFSDLKHNNPLRSYHPEQGYTYLQDTLQRIAELKTAGINPSEFAKIIEENAKFLKEVGSIISDLFVDRISAKKLHIFADAIIELNKLPDSSLKDTILDSLNEAYQEATAGSKVSTKPITAWKTKFTKKNQQKESILKDLDKSEKLQALATIYQQYQDQLHRKGYFDFSDMLLDTTAALEANSELRYNIQEQYLYILVDEFQDTNGVQMKLLDSLLDASVNEGRPNILAVGDDDQAIFKFQGANIQNILGFHEKYRDPSVVVLDKNYRSTQEILDFTRPIITQGKERLENILPNISKELQAAKTEQAGYIVERTFEDPTQELIWIAKEIDKNKTPKNEIALIARTHRQLEHAAKVLDYFKIPVSYERKKNLLEQQHIKQILSILEFITNTTQDQHLPEILSYKFWGLDRIAVWSLSAESYKSKKLWLEHMLETPELKPLAEFFIHLEQEAKEKTAEEIIDYITGSKEINEFTSPYRNYYFKDTDQNYLDFLTSLQAFIQAIRNHKGTAILTVTDILDYVELHQKHRLPLTYTSPSANNEKAVQLLTAHSAKGLEFDTVYVVNCQDSSWIGRHMPNKLSFPSNLSLSAEKDSEEDKLRLFYVALTRAKNHLYLTHHKHNHTGKEQVKLRFLSEPEKDLTVVETPESLIETQFEILRHITPTPSENELLKTLVQNYQLSVTHLNNFLDLTNCGPQKFLENNILRFPQMMSAPAAYGSAVHNALHRLQTDLKHNEQLATLDFLLDQFQQSLQRHRLNKKDFNKLLEKGKDQLSNFYEQRKDNFNPKDISEFDFRDQGVQIGNASITGKIDKITINPETHEMLVFDYKTGKAMYDWNGRYDYELVKSWKHKNQLIFYKLLVENARSFRGKYTVNQGVLEFIEPHKDEIKTLSLTIDTQELAQLTKLIQIVYHKITNLDFPDTSEYEQSFFGIQHFIIDLLEKRI